MPLHAKFPPPKVMDTRFWGPSGWKLIHLIAADTEGATARRRAAILSWFRLLEYVLPCKYCRASFHDYIRLQPLTPAIVADTDAFGRWAYDIHNRVNAKLRGQGLLTTADPDWPTVRDRYRDEHRGLCDGSPLLGWDFLVSVAYTTPAADYEPVPMPDYDATTHTQQDVATRNRYNLLTRSERLPFLARWWRLLPSILPCAQWRRVWSNARGHEGAPPLGEGREATLAWLWRMEAAVCRDLRCPVPHSCVRAMKREAAAFESGCGVARRGKTCRTRKVAQRRAVRTRRARKGVVVL
jgi:hypothetical protein